MKSKKWYKGLTATAIALALAGAAAIPAYAEDAEEMNDTDITTSTSENQTIDQAADAVIDKVIDGNVNWGETGEDGRTPGQIGENGEGGGVGRTETDGNTTTDEKYDESKASTSVSGPSYVDENGNTVTPTTTVTPGTKETTTEGTGEIKGELSSKEEVKEDNTDIKADFDGVNFDNITDDKITDKNGKEYNVTDNGNGQYTLTREENLEGKLGDKDIAKLLNGYTKNEDGTYTKVNGDTTTVITITGNTVNRRVQTKLTVSTKETEKDSEDQTGTVTDKTTGDIENTAGGTLSVSELLEKAKADGANVEKDANGNITKFTDADGKEYEFTYESGEGNSVNPSTLGADKLAGLLGDGYSVKDGKIILTDANGEHEITLDDAKSELVKKTVKVTVKTKEKHEESDEVKESVNEEAKNKALAEAKKKAAEALGIDENKFTLKDGTTDTYVYTDESGKTYSFKLTAKKKPDSQGDMSEADKSKIDGFEYGTKFTITYESTASDSTIVTPGQKDLGNAPFELDENGSIKGATKVDDTHYTITKVVNEKTYTYTITITDITDVGTLTDDEKALLEGRNGEELGNLSLKRYSWTSTASYDDVVENGGVHEKDGSYIEKGEGNTFTYHDKDGNTISGLKKNDDGSYSYTDADHVKHTYTVSERDMTADEIKAMLEKAGYTDVELGADGKATGKKDGAAVDITYTKQKITDITVKSEDGGAFNSQDELLEWIKGEAAKLQEGETLKFGKKEITKDTEITWEFIKDEVESVTNFSQMSDQEIISLLKKQQQTAKDNNNYYDGSEGKWVDGYWDWESWHWVEGHWEKDPNYIGHFDLATDANLTLTDKTKTDCILIEKNLEWNYDADKLVKGEGNTKVGLSNNISYDNEDGTDGHYEYPRASWDGSSKKNDKNPEKSAFYKLTGTVAYGTAEGIDGKYRDKGWGWNKISGKEAAEKALQDYIDKQTKGHSPVEAEKIRAQYKNAQVVRIYDDQEYSSCHYKIYLYTAELTTYGYMDKTGNTCVNKDFKRQDSSTSTEYIGGYDLTISELTQTSDGKVIGQGGSTTSYSGKLTKSKKDNGKQSMTVNAVKEGSVQGESGSAIKGDYTLTETLGNQYATGIGSYNEYTVSKTGSAQGESYEGNVLYTYKVHDETVIDPDAKLKSETVTQDNFRLNYNYTKTTVEEIEKEEEGTIVIPPTPIIVPGEKEDIIIREDDPPLTPAPSEDVTIDDEETPLTPAPIPDDVIDDIIMEIEDEVVPLASVPKTGEAGNAAAAAAGGALAGLAFLAFFRKRKNK